MLTRRDYVVLADALRKIRATRAFVAALGDLLLADNPRFDRARFDAAAVPTPAVSPGRPTLVFDSRGINGPDEYRSRVATFANPTAAREWGHVFAAAPVMREALEAVADSGFLSDARGDDSGGHILATVRAALRCAAGKEA